MKKLLLETSFSKIYMIVMIIITLLLVGGYFSYAMFTVSKEKSNAISIVTGSLTYKLEVDGKESNKLVVPSGITKKFIVTLSNPNNRVARFNFYYLGNLKEGVDTGYIEEDGYNITPVETGVNLEKDGTSGSSNTYIIRVSNTTGEEITINLGVSVGLDYNDLSLPNDGHLFPKYEEKTIDKILEDNKVKIIENKMFNYASNGIQYLNGELTEVNEKYVTNGLYKSEDEDGVSYFYRGNIDNNNVQFGTYDNDYYVYVNGAPGYEVYHQSLDSCNEFIKFTNRNEECKKIKLASKDDKMYWKILRINGDGSLRLIYNGTSATPTNNDLAHSFIIGSGPYNLSKDNPKYSGYTYDNGTDSFIKKEVDTWYKNTLGSNSYYDSKVIEGRFCSDSSGYESAEYYNMVGDIFDKTDYLFSSIDRLDQFVTQYQKDNSPTLKCPETSENYGGSYRLKAGLITADELLMAGEIYGVPNDGYLNLDENNRNLYYSTMTPAIFYERTVSGSNGITVFYEAYDLNSTFLNNYSNHIRPVINIDISTSELSGDGSSSNPYQLESTS